MNKDYLISVQHLRKTFGSTIAVNDVSIDINAGEIFGFLGANGSGKTTTLRMLCGLLTPDAGQGNCLGFNLISQASLIKNQLGYMTQRFSLYEELTVIENLKFIAQMYDIENKKNNINKLIDRFNLNKIRNQLAGTMSGGQKQRLALATCLIHNPKLLLLDEPTAGVDPKARGDFWDIIHMLSEQGVTTLLSTHYMDEAERCSRLAYMSYGNILIQGTRTDIINKTALQTFEVSGDQLMPLAKELRKNKSISQVILYGTTIHVSGMQSEAFTQTIQKYSNKNGTKWVEIDSTLEDVFINLMTKDELQ